MRKYRITFVKNEVISCEQMKDSIEFQGKYQYQHKNGQLIYAFVKAESEAGAIAMAYIIVQEVKEKQLDDDVPK